MAQLKIDKSALSAVEGQLKMSRNELMNALANIMSVSKAAASINIFEPPVYMPGLRDDEAPIKDYRSSARTYIKNAKDLYSNALELCEIKNDLSDIIDDVGNVIDAVLDFEGMAMDIDNLVVKSMGSVGLNSLDMASFGTSDSEEAGVLLTDLKTDDKELFNVEKVDGSSSKLELVKSLGLVLSGAGVGLVCSDISGNVTLLKGYKEDVRALEVGAIMGDEASLLGIPVDKEDNVAQSVSSVVTTLGSSLLGTLVVSYDDKMVNSTIDEVAVTIGKTISNKVLNSPIVSRILNKGQEKVIIEVDDNLDKDIDDIKSDTISLEAVSTVVNNEEKGKNDAEDEVVDTREESILLDENLVGSQELDDEGNDFVGEQEDINKPIIESDSDNDIVLYFSNDIEEEKDDSKSIELVDEDKDALSNEEVINKESNVPIISDEEKDINVLGIDNDEEKVRKDNNIENTIDFINSLIDTVGDESNLIIDASDNSNDRIDSDASDEVDASSDVNRALDNFFGESSNDIVGTINKGIGTNDVISVNNANGINNNVVDSNMTNNINDGMIRTSQVINEFSSGNMRQTVNMQQESYNSVGVEQVERNLLVASDEVKKPMAQEFIIATEVTLVGGILAVLLKCRDIIDMVVCEILIGAVIFFYIIFVIGYIGRVRKSKK